MWRSVFLFTSGVLIAASARLAAQEGSAAPPGTPAQASARRAEERAPTGGAPENRSRYRLSNGRWWYRTPDNRWSYFDGSRWRPYTAGIGYVRRPVDPALLRLEYKEGVLGRRRWPRVGGGLIWQGGGEGLPLSGTQGSAGGAPSGSFTDPVGVPSGINTSIGTSTGVGGLNGAGRAFSGFGVGPTMGSGRPR
ncbi:MAG TPA: hypothetical protein VNH11_01005 [Pirellulales bacterium]|nr:hypothetical protein [Pirellulales bacterium]